MDSKAKRAAQFFFEGGGLGHRRGGDKSSKEGGTYLWSAVSPPHPPPENKTLDSELLLTSILPNRSSNKSLDCETIKVFTPEHSHTRCMYYTGEGCRTWHIAIIPYCSTIGRLLAPERTICQGKSLQDFQDKIYRNWEKCSKTLFKICRRIMGNRQYYIRVGLNKNINKFEGIFHGGLTPPLPWKVIKKFFQNF